MPRRVPTPTGASDTSLWQLHLRRLEKRWRKTASYCQGKARAAVRRTGTQDRDGRMRYGLRGGPFRLLAQNKKQTRISKRRTPESEVGSQVTLARHELVVSNRGGCSFSPNRQFLFTDHGGRRTRAYAPEAFFRRPDPPMNRVREFATRWCYLREVYASRILDRSLFKQRAYPPRAKSCRRRHRDCASSHVVRRLRASSVDSTYRVSQVQNPKAKPWARRVTRLEMSRSEEVTHLQVLDRLVGAFTADAG